MSCGWMELEEASHITSWILEKAVWALGHVMAFFWSRIWSAGLGEDRETSRMSMVDGAMLGV